MCSGYPNFLGDNIVAKCGSVFTGYGLDPIEIDAVDQLEIIQYDYANFNDILGSVKTIFQIITLEGWSKLMYNY